MHLSEGRYSRHAMTYLPLGFLGGIDRFIPWLTASGCSTYVGRLTIMSISQSSHCQLVFFCAPSHRQKCTSILVALSFWDHFRKLEEGNATLYSRSTTLESRLKHVPSAKLQLLNRLHFWKIKFFLRHGVPRVLISDCGTPLMSLQFSDYLK